MAAGKPLLLVADASSEIGRVIEENRIGWIVPPNQPDVLAQRIDDLCRAGDWEKIGGRARKVVEEWFSEQVILSRYSRYFQGLLEESEGQESSVVTTRWRRMVAYLVRGETPNTRSGGSPPGYRAAGSRRPVLSHPEARSFVVPDRRVERNP
jgi:hypothetical protein